MIIKPLLRSIQQETTKYPAPDGAYRYCFDQLIAMFESWEVLGSIKLCQCFPDSMDDAWGAQDPANDIWPLLLMEVAQYYMYAPTMDDRSRAAASMRRLKARSSKQRKMKPYKNAPRGSGNTGYNYCVEVEEDQQDCNSPFECES